MHKLIYILIGTYNGEKFLQEQLESIASQTYTNWKLIASDDGSSDRTIEILEKYQEKWGSRKLEIRKGKNHKGFAANFMSLACDTSLSADLYAFCDQDDIWLPGKLEAAVDALYSDEHEVHPQLYCSRTILVSEKLKYIGYSPLVKSSPSFGNALVQSIAGGNTMVFNRAAKLLIQKNYPYQVISHDWWLYILVMGVGGTVFYDANPKILYRQHTDSVIGLNNSFKAQLLRILWLLMGRFRGWNTTNLVALSKFIPLLNNENALTLVRFIQLRNSHVINRIRMIKDCKLYRWGRRQNIALYFAALLKKI